ncbi:DUF3302 domain-containing protein [Rubritalea spongiae]|uniref:DUF3302 domain-containing protein n=1 Tax=Rubritalea spongiae TaxID=430797 RepID=A0ABW5E2W0_9BACT
MFLDYFALFLLIFVVIAIFYGIIAIHDIPHEIAKKRNHPHEDAIGVAGWVSLFTLHLIWPLLWIWSMLYRPDRGWGLQNSSAPSSDQSEAIQQLRNEIEKLNREVTSLRDTKNDQHNTSL